MINHEYIKPNIALSEFIDSFWMLHNASDMEKLVDILPDGNIDLFFTETGDTNFHITLLGLGTQAMQAAIAPWRKTLAISFRPLGVEYLLQESVASLLNKATDRTAMEYPISALGHLNLQQFALEMTSFFEGQIPATIDRRKRKLFQAIDASSGAISVAELSELCSWSSRQINRYFNKHLGLSLKTYCSIIRFKSSFTHIKAGKLSPELAFADQSHFIKEVKKRAGVNPKQLNQNQNDRFIQLSTLTKP